MLNRAYFCARLSAQLQPRNGDDGCYRVLSGRYGGVVSAGDEKEQSHEDEGPGLPLYQRPWLRSTDGVSWFPTSWGGLVALFVVIVAGVVIVNWIGSLL